MNAHPAYWEIVWKQFKKRTRAMVAFYLIMAVFAVAWLAPVVVTNRPLLMWTDAGFSMPAVAELFRARFKIDAFFNGGLIALPISIAALVWWKRRVASGLAFDFHDHFIRWSAFQFVAWGLIGLAMMAASQPRLDSRDFRQIARESEGVFVFAPVPKDPYRADGEILAGPTLSEPLGTDHVGRSVFARMTYGTRIALSVGFVAVSIAVAIGLVVGAMAGFFGGWVDFSLSRLIEIVICIPSFFLILILIATLGGSIFWVMLAIGITGWTGIARLTRGEFLRLRNQDFVTAARALGAGRLRIIFRQIMPNAIGPVLVSITFGVAGAILTESGLSFLGLGDVSLASWGETLSQGRLYLEQAWWLILFPGLAVFYTVLNFNLVGEGLRDAMDPRLRE